MKRLFKLLLNRIVVAAVFILIQLAFLIALIIGLSDHFVYVYGALLLLSIAMIVWIVNKNDNPSVKLPWVIMILILPLFGGLLYIFFGSIRLPKQMRLQLQRLWKVCVACHDPCTLLPELTEKDPHAASNSAYLYQATGMPPHKNTETMYLSPGEVKWQHLLTELKKAEHFIFMEYFIIEEGKMWSEILDILALKAKEGLDVRVMYDDIGCCMTLPSGYHKKLEAMGIQCVVFNRLQPTLSILFNNRDHRKITVIDGNIGFTGGINLADEYINAFEKYGYWKDCAVMLKGDAVWNLTLMFLQHWNFSKEESEDFNQFRPTKSCSSDGYVQPYMDSPLDHERVGETVYLNIIYNATKYLYINTPYLIVDNELVTALTTAAKRGVDVRLVAPGVADKWYVHLITQAYYPHLIEAGVKIYEFTPGFLHSKTFLADDTVGTIGTINMDYRSLYHHFECGVLFYESSALSALKEDYLNTLEKCRLITIEDCENVPLPKRFLRGAIRLFSPLL